MRTPTPGDWDEVDVEEKPRTEITPRAPARLRTAAGTLPPNRRRGTADDVIESGEIVERRSLVIRSRMQSVEWTDEPTEITVAAPISHKRSWRLLWLAGAIACGIAAVVLLLRAKPDATRTSALEGRAEMIGTMLDGEARAALVRADAIATAPMLRAAIETDATTLADMARDNDLALALEPGDVIEVFQVRGAQRLLLLRLPAGAKPIDAPAAGQTRIAAADKQLVAVAKARIANKRSKLAGEIVLSTPIDLAPVSQRIAEYTSGAVLTGVGDTVVLVANRTSPNITIPITTKTPLAGSLALAAVVPQPTASVAYLFLTASLLLVAIFIVFTVRARRAT